MATADDFQATFDTLRKLLTPYAKAYPPIVDEPGRYFLASKISRTRSGSPIWFGGVEIRKRYVSYHLTPIYAQPALLEHASASLLKRKQGKSCFNFTAIEPAHVKELAALTRRGYAGFLEKYP
jgi:hypothetical protein